MTGIERRQLWIKVHRYLGLAIVLFLIAATVSGVILSFARPLDAALNSDLFTGPRERIDSLLAVRHLSKNRPDLIVLSFPTQLEAKSTVLVGVAAQPGASTLGYDQVFLDSSQAHIRGVRQTGPGFDRRHLVEGIFTFHSTLLLGTVGRWVMGLAALGWFVGNLVGIYLTLPIKGAFWKQWKRMWQMRRSSPLPRLLLDLHRASGLWLLVGVSILAFTSVAMNFFEEAFTPIVQTLSPARPSLFDRPARPAAKAAVPQIDGPAALAIAATAARAQGLGWRPAEVSYVANYGVYGVMFSDDGFENYHRLGPITLYVDAHSGRIVDRDDPYSDSGGRMLSRALYPLHTGQVAGWFGVAIVVMLGLATLEMIGTGLYLWLKRRPMRVKARRAARAASAR